MKQKLETLKQKIGAETSREQVSTEERNTQLRAATALLTLVGFLTPWVTLDGYAGAMSGSDLIKYALLNPERASLFQVSWMGTIALLTMPLATLAATLYGFYRSLTGDPSLGAHLGAATAPILMLVLAGSILSSEAARFFGMPLPGFGVAAVIITQGGLFVERLTEADK